MERKENKRGKEGGRKIVDGGQKEEKQRDKVKDVT